MSSKLLTSIRFWQTLWNNCSPVYWRRCGSSAFLSHYHCRRQPPHWGRDWVGLSRLELYKAICKLNWCVEKKPQRRLTCLWLDASWRICTPLRTSALSQSFCRWAVVILLVTAQTPKGTPSWLQGPWFQNKSHRGMHLVHEKTQRWGFPVSHILPVQNFIGHHELITKQVCF